MEQNLLNDNSLIELHQNIDQYVETQGTALGNRLAGMNGEALYQAIAHSQALKGLSQDYQDAIQNTAVRVWTLELSQELHQTNQRFMRWLLPGIGGLMVLLLIANFSGKSTTVKENGNTYKQATEYLK
jgi:hypothetical protein